MGPSFRAGISVLAVFACQALAADRDVAMELAATIEVRGVKGRIDHFALDPATRHVFIAALDNGSVEVIHADRKYHASIPGFGQPQGMAYVPASHRLFVANGAAGRVEVIDVSTLTVRQRIVGLDQADHIRYDHAMRSVVVGYGNGALAILDAARGELVARLEMPGHPEAFEMEQRGPRGFVNVPSAGKVVVFDRLNLRVIESWDVPGATDNYSMALDEGGRRLFVGTRSPALMLAYDIDTGRVVARVPMCKDADDMYFDADRKRIYAICGEGRVDVIRQQSPDRYVQEGSVDTASKARTGILVPEEGRLYVAAPATGSLPARIFAYRLR